MSHFPGSALDRLEPLRIGSAAEPFSPDTRVLALWQDRVLLRDGERREAAWTLLGSGGVAGDLVLLGARAGLRWAARALGSGEEADELARTARGSWEAFRAAAALLPAEETGLLAHARALLAWHDGTRHCGACGAPTRLAAAGYQRVCSAEACARVCFPRTDPAVITLITSGERCLLVHQPGWAPGHFATVAGFLEPGESLEEGVAREVAEEVGLRALSVAYRHSQPWPFPHSVMIGFRTEVEPGTPTLGEEIAEARWFSRAELRRAVAFGQVSLPSSISISRTLVDEWLEEVPPG